MSDLLLEKPKFDKDQLVTSTDISRKFSAIRKQAKEKPLVVTENGRFDTVILDYQAYEKMFCRLTELEERFDFLILSERLEGLERNPETGVNWSDIRRSGE